MVTLVYTAKRRFTHYDRSRVYVVEFWATWCPSCVDAMPQLTALQSKHRDKLTVVGVNVLESAMGEGDENSVRAFVRNLRKALNQAIPGSAGLR